MTASYAEAKRIYEYTAMTAPAAAGNDATGFVGEMWDTYRMDYPYPPYSRRYAARLTPNE